MDLFFSKWYTRLTGVYFIFIAVPLVGDFAAHGFHAETMHKLFHIVLGLIVITWGWKDERWWRVFPLSCGLFFLYAALFGLIFPDFAGLDAFNRADTILHTIVGVTGVVAALIDRARG